MPDLSASSRATGAPPAAAGRSHAFTAPGYTWLWLTSLFNAVAWTVQGLSLGWLVLELTGSPLWVGAAAAARGAGMFAFSIPAGTIGDRADRRRILLASQAVPGLASFALAAIVLFGAAALWHVIVYSVIVGVASAAERPASSSLMYDLVGRAQLFGASALRFLAGSLIRVVGAVAGGYVIDALGVGPNYAMVGLAHAASVFCVLLLRVQAPSPRPSAPFLAATRDGLAHALHEARIRRFLLLSLTTEGFGFSYNTMLPVMAREVLHTGGLGLGYLTAASGVGQIAATLTVARRGHFDDEQRVVTVFACGFGALIALFGLSPWFPLSLALVTAVGAVGAVYDAGMATVLLVLSADAMRARIQGLYNSTIGFNLLSGLGVGFLATFLGPPAALAISGAIAAGSAAVLGRRRPGPIA